MIRVLHLLTDTNVGGAGRFLLSLVRHTDRDAFEPLVALPKDAALLSAFEALGVRVIPLDGCRDRSFTLADTRELLRVIRREKPDVVSANACLSGRIAAFLCRVPCRVFTRHSAFPAKGALTRFPVRPLTGLVQRILSTDVIAVAEAAADNLVSFGIPQDRITVIHNVAEPPRAVAPEEIAALRASLGIPDGAFVAGMLTRMEPYKGCTDFLDAAGIVLRDRPDTYFLCVGTGSEEAALREKAAALPAGHVLFPGFTSDPALWLSLFSVAVNASYGTETSSLTIHEAAALGVPTVASTYGGNPELIRDGENGLLFPPRDADALARALLRAANDEKLLRELAEGARRHYAAEGTADEWAARTCDIYRRRLAANRHTKHTK